MNIALVFFGQLRYLRPSYAVWKKNIIDPLEITDIYAHTWLEQDNILDFKNIFNPKKLLLTSYDNVKETDRWIENPLRKRSCVRNTFNVQCLFFSVFNSMQLVEKTYDYIIMSRIDHIFYNPINKELLNCIHDNELLSSTAMHNHFLDGRWHSMCDWFAIGKPEEVKKFSYVGRDYKKLYDNGVQFHSETLFGENAKDKKLLVNPIFVVDKEHCLSVNLPKIADPKTTFVAPVPKHTIEIYESSI